MISEKGGLARRPSFLSALFKGGEPAKPVVGSALLSICKLHITKKALWK